MKIGMIGLGRMGMNMTRRLLQSDIEVVVFNRTYEKSEQIAKEGAYPAKTIQELVASLVSPKVIWLMLPEGKIVDEHIEILTPLLTKDDIVIEGGNSFYKDDIRRYGQLKEKGINYLDAGVSGGIWGLKIGYCTMVGGDKACFDYTESIFKALAPEDGYKYCGETGAGHFVKMIHNGIEYALMEAYGEGFELLKASSYGENLNLESIAKLWNKGSVIRSWLLELLEDSFKEDTNLEKIQGYVEDSGEARWTVKEAVDSGVSATVIAHSLFKRFQSRQENTFSDKVVASLRNQFGGHALASIQDQVKNSEVGAGEVRHAKKDVNYNT